MSKSEDEKQIALLKAVITQKRIDAWDLGYQHVLSPGDIDGAIRKLIERFGIQGTWKMVLPMNKAPYRP